MVLQVNIVCTCFKMVIPMMVAQTVAMTGEEDSGTGHLASRSLLVLAMPTASVESFHEPLLSCRSATVASLTPAIPSNTGT